MSRLLAVLVAISVLPFAAQVLKTVPTDRCIGTPPLAFTFGLGGVLLFPLHAGASTLLIEKASPTELADLINQHAVTVCFTAPTAYRAMCGMLAEHDVSSLRRMLYGASPMPEAVLLRAPYDEHAGPGPLYIDAFEARRHARPRDLPLPQCGEAGPVGEGVLAGVALPARELGGAADDALHLEGAAAAVQGHRLELHRGAAVVEAGLVDLDAAVAGRVVRDDAVWGAAP